MQWLNYHHLYYFYIIASEGSVTEATVKLRLAQSTLSAQLKQFEDVIGYKLFERKHRKLILTDVGRKVFNYAHEIFSLGEELRDSLGNFEDSLRVSLKLGIVDSIPKKISRALVHTTSKKFEARTIVLEESLSSLLEKLADHNLDIILANGTPPLEGRKSSFHVKLIGELPIIFVSRPADIELTADFPRSLDGKPIILPGSHNPLRQEIVEHLRLKHIQPHVIAEVDDLELQKMLVLDGHGFSALPIVAVEDELKSGRLIRLSETPLCHENLWFITAHRLVHNPISKALLESFRV